MGVTHASVVTVSDDPNFPVGTGEWNAAHKGVVLADQPIPTAAT